MADRAAVNASPLIFLARASLLDMLRILGEVVVPRPVFEELQRRGPDDVTVKALGAASWLTVVTSPVVPPVIQAWDLGAGESAVLAWALANPGAEVVIDDREGRRCAAALQIPVRGTLGLVLVAKKRARIDKARPVLEMLRAAGMRLSSTVLDRALAEVGE